MASVLPQNSVIIQQLLEATSDKSEHVNVTIYLSLKKIALEYPSEVISAAIDYRRRNPKLNNREIRNIFVLIKNVCEEKLSSIENPLIEEIINHAIEESLKASVVPFTSADLLPVIGTKYCDQVFSQLQKYMSEGVAPHASVIYTLGNLSVANMVVFQPFSLDVFKYLLSILHVTKSDYMRRLYANTVCQLVESVMEQIPSHELATKKYIYSSHIEEIFDILTTTWLLVKDSNVCELITKAIGCLVLLFSNEKLSNDASRILNSFLSLYKKQVIFPRYVISQGLSNFLSVVPRAALEPLLDSVLCSLNIMVTIYPDFTLPETVKNHNEVLRCYDYIGNSFEDKLPDSLMSSLKSSIEQDKLVGLIVSTHLLNAPESIFKGKISNLITSLHTLINDTSIKVNKSLVKIINVLAYRGFLTEKDTTFIEFLVRHSFHHTVSNPEQDDLELMSRNTLSILITTIPAVQSLCWKVLIQLLMNGEHIQSISVSAKSLAHLITNCELSLLERNCYDRSEVIFVRVVAFLGSPLHDNRGVYLLNFLKEYIQWKVKIDTIIWKKKMLELISYLENSVWNDIDWENNLLDTLSASFTNDTKPWLEAVNGEAVKLLIEYTSSSDQSSYNNYSNNVIIDERAMLYKLLALLTQYMDDGAAVNTNISKIMLPIYQRSLVDLRACSRSIGILSRVHFKQVFNILDKFQQTELNKKPTKFLGFIKDTKGETEIEIIRRMVCECFSAILIDAPAKSLLPKLTQLQTWFICLIQQTKDCSTIQSCWEALHHISQVLLKNEDSLETIDDCRKSLLSFIVTSVHNEKCMPSVITLKTIANIFKLSSFTSATEKLHLLQKSLSKMYQFYSVSSSTINISEMGVIENDLIIQQLSLLIEHAVDTKNTTVLEEIVIFLRPWLSHKILNHRLISLYLLRSALNSYITCYFNDTKNYGKFVSVGSLLGRLYIRTYEENTQASRLAGECIVLLFAIAEANSDNISSTIEDIQSMISGTEVLTVDFFRASVYNKLSNEQLKFLTEELMNGLLDTEKSSAAGTASLLTILFMEVGVKFSRHAVDIFNDFISKLMKIEYEDVQRIAIGAMLALAKYHKEIFLNTMLNQPIPFHKNICLCWEIVAENETLTDELLKKLFEIMKWNLPHEEEAENKIVENAPIRPLVAIVAVKELISHPKLPSDFVASHFVDLLPTTLMLLPVYMGKGTTKVNGVTKASKESFSYFIPAKMIFETIISLMKHANCENIEDNFCTYAEKIDFKKSDIKPIYNEMTKNLAKYISGFESELVIKILDSIGYYTNNEKTEGQRITAVIFFVEIFNLKCCEDPVLVDTVMINLLNFLNDESAFIRENSLRGLANISNLESALVERYKERLLSALTTGLEDSEGNTQVGIIIQSLIGLSKLLPFLTHSQYTSILVSIAVRIKPFFEKDDAEVRQLSLRLFGELAAVSSTEMSSFKEQIIRNLPCILFHCGEKDNSVVQACKYTLKAICSTLKSDTLSKEINYHLSLDEAKFDYQVFLVKVTELLSSEIDEMSSNYISIAITYTKSSWPEIRASAVLFVGTMYASQGEMTHRLTADTLANRTLALLKDIDSKVRANAATSLALLLHSSASANVNSKLVDE